jgi:hypothetical protein
MAGIHCSVPASQPEEGGAAEITAAPPALSVVRARVQDWYDQAIDFRDPSARNSASRNIEAKGFIYQGEDALFTFIDDSEIRLLLNPENHPHPERCTARPGTSIARCAPLVGVSDFLLWNAKWPVAGRFRRDLLNGVPGAPKDLNPLQISRHKSTITDIAILANPGKMSPQWRAEWGDFVAIWTVKASISISAGPYTATFPDHYVTVQAGFKGSLQFVRYVVKQHRVF